MDKNVLKKGKRLCYKGANNTVTTGARADGTYCDLHPIPAIELLATLTFRGSSMRKEKSCNNILEINLLHKRSSRVIFFLFVFDIHYLIGEGRESP